MKRKLENYFSLRIKNQKNSKANGNFGYFDSILETMNVCSPDENLFNNFFNKKQQLSSIASVFHEKVHVYQHFGSSICFYKAFIMHLQNKLAINFLQNLDFEIPVMKYLTDNKDMINDFLRNEGSKLYSNQDKVNDINLVDDFIEKWLNVEVLTMLIDGEFGDEEIDKLVDFRVEYINYTLVPIMHSMFSQLGYRYLKIKSPINAMELVGLLGEKISDRPCYIQDNDGDFFGTKHILEAQAKFAELMKYGELHQRGEFIFSNFEEFNYYQEESLPGKIYNSAYDIYNEIVDIKENLVSTTIFSIICDYSLNPVIPPLFDVNELYTQQISGLLPQVRFVHLCNAFNSMIKKGKHFHYIDEDTNEKREFIDLKDYNDINQFIRKLYEFFEEETGYLSPNKVAFEYVELYDNRSISDERVGANFSYNCELYYNACKIRLECPLFFVNPGHLSSINREKYLEFSNLIKIPMFGINEEFGVVDDDEHSIKYLHKVLENQVMRDIFLSKELKYSDFDKYRQLNKEYYLGFYKELFNRNIDKFFK